MKPLAYAVALTAFFFMGRVYEQRQVAKASFFVNVDAETGRVACEGSLGGYNYPIDKITTRRLGGDIQVQFSGYHRN